MPVYSIGGIQIPVYSVWESQFPPEAAEEGRGVTEAIWVDMTQFAGCIAHQLLRTSTTPATCPSSASGRLASTQIRFCASTPTTPTHGARTSWCPPAHALPRPCDRRSRMTLGG